MNTKTKIYIGIIIMLLVAIIVALAVGLNRPVSQPQQTPASNSAASSESHAPKIIQIEKEVTSEIIQEKLRDMGFLVTQEYDCTGVLSSSKVKTLFKIEIPFTESSYIVTYDATVEAGIDFTKITVDKDDESKLITVHLPDAEIKSVSIDYGSFTLYSEKDGLGTNMTVADYNDSLKEYESTTRKKAVDKGILDKASENAKLVVENFVQSLADTSEYRIKID